jgi:transposase
MWSWMTRLTGSSHETKRRQVFDQRRASQRAILEGQDRVEELSKEYDETQGRVTVLVQQGKMGEAKRAADKAVRLRSPLRLAEKSLSMSTRLDAMFERAMSAQDSQQRASTMLNFLRSSELMKPKNAMEFEREMARTVTALDLAEDAMDDALEDDSLDQTELTAEEMVAQALDSQMSGVVHSASRVPPQQASPEEHQMGNKDRV